MKKPSKQKEKSGGRIKIMECEWKLKVGARRCGNADAGRRRTRINKLHGGRARAEHACFSDPLGRVGLQILINAARRILSKTL